MENQTPEFFEQKDILGQPKSDIPANTETERIIPPNPADEYEDASSTARFVNYFIDTIGVIVMGIAVYIILGLLGKGYLLEGANEKLVGIILSFFYYAIIETATAGRSLGKFVTGTKVITTEGAEPDFSTCMGRTLCRFIPFDGLSFLVGANGWHDRFSNTRVVKIRN